MTCRDREKNNFPFTDNTNEDCEGNYYSTQCIIVSGIDGHENKPMNDLIEGLLDSITELESKVRTLIDNVGFDGTVTSEEGKKFKIIVDEEGNLLTEEITDEE